MSFGSSDAYATANGGASSHPSTINMPVRATDSAGNSAKATPRALLVVAR